MVEQEIAVKLAFSDGDYVLILQMIGMQCHANYWVDGNPNRELPMRYLAIAAALLSIPAYAADIDVAPPLEVEAPPPPVVEAPPPAVVTPPATIVTPPAVAVMPAPTCPTVWRCGPWGCGYRQVCAGYAYGYGYHHGYARPWHGWGGWGWHHHH